MNRICFVGRSCTGKDTRADVLERLRPDTWRGAFATALKVEVAALNGVTVPYLEAHKGEFRSQLQAIGHGRRQEFGEDYWVEKLEDQIVQVQSDLRADGRPYLPFMVVTDARYQNEIDMLRRLGFGAVRLRADIPVLQERYKAKHGIYMTDEQLNHPTETMSDTLDVDDEWDATGDPEWQIRGWLLRQGLGQIRRLFRAA
jgi:hypothetical protein